MGSLCTFCGGMDPNISLMQLAAPAVLWIPISTPNTAKPSTSRLTVRAGAGKAWPQQVRCWLCLKGASSARPPTRATCTCLGRVGHVRRGLLAVHPGEPAQPIHALDPLLHGGPGGEGRFRGLEAQEGLPALTPGQPQPGEQSLRSLRRGLPR